MKGRASRYMWALALTLAGCGEDRSSPHESAREPPRQTSAPTPVAPAPAAPIDLLSAVEVDLAVSSTTPSLRRGPTLLVDGDLTTAWNSRGDDESPAIALRLPPDIEVTSIELTAGYTKVDDDRDLFLGNRRVRRVRVSREGVELGVFSLDPESRALQALDVRGAGGVWTIEIVESVPGEVRRWTETCVSELRVMGHAPAGASPRTRFLVGGLEHGLDLAAIEAAHRRLVPVADQPVRSESELLARSALVLTAYAVRCPPSKAVRWRIRRARERMAAFLDDVRSAESDLEWLACPGPGAVGVGAARDDAREALWDAEDTLNDATLDLQLAMGIWASACGRTFGGAEEELDIYIPATGRIGDFTSREPQAPF